ISKKWYVDRDFSPESVEGVWIDYRKVFSEPTKVFEHWIINRGQRLSFRIDYGIRNDRSAPASSANSTVTDPIFNVNTLRGLVKDWARTWRSATNQSNFVNSSGTEPYVAAIQIVPDEAGSYLDFQIMDWTGHQLRPLTRIIQSGGEEFSKRMSRNVFN